VKGANSAPMSTPPRENKPAATTSLTCGPRILSVLGILKKDHRHDRPRGPVQLSQGPRMPRGPPVEEEFEGLSNVSTTMDLNVQSYDEDSRAVVAKLSVADQLKAGRPSARDAHVAGRVPTTNRRPPPRGLPRHHLAPQATAFSGRDRGQSQTAPAMLCKTSVARSSGPTTALLARGVRLRRTCSLLRVPVCPGVFGTGAIGFRCSVIAPFQESAAA